MLSAKSSSNHKGFIATRAVMFDPFNKRRMNYVIAVTLTSKYFLYL